MTTVVSERLRQGSNGLTSLVLLHRWYAMADTLCSAAILVAASIASHIESVEGYEADSVATLLVSVIIFISLFSLV